jgi:glycosyltransferase involved in cell wall biosynthesis
LKKILHIITGIGAGGAERVLHNIVSFDKNDHFIISLKKKNFIKTPYNFDNFKVIYLNLNIFNFITKFIHLVYLIKKINPEIAQTWMYHADFFGGLAAKVAGTKKIFWNIRNSTLNKKTKFSTKLVLKINVILSFFIPSLIICCSKNAIKIHLLLGYKNKFAYIPNGIKKKNKKYYNNTLNKKVLIKKDEFIISYVGRWHLQKDFKTLFKSLKILKLVFGQNNWKILMAGNNIDKYNNDIIKLIKLYSLETEVKLLGQLKDVDKLYSLTDVNVLSSSNGEAFPNVVLEAMSQGVPCIVTKVGESKQIVSNYGWCVEIKKPLEFARCIYQAINLKKNSKLWNNLKLNCKRSVFQRYEMHKMIASYNQVWAKN